jgi:TolB-like protein
VAEGDGEEETTGAHSAAPDVFISYASPDSAVAETVCEALERAGVTCWIAPRDVTPGTFYADEIVHAIDAAKAIVLILSQNAAESPHVLREVERAASKRHPVVSLRIDHAPLPAGLEYFLNTSQWLDASAGDKARAMPKLVAAVRIAIEKPATPDSAIAGAPTRASYPAGGDRARTAILAGSLLIVAIAGFAAYRSWQLARQSAAPRTPTVIAATPAAVPAALAIPEKSVAVLPFTDLSEKKDQEYFADGMAEEILDLLAKIPGLTVIGRTSSFQFKGKNEDLRTIGAKLNAAYILEGSVRKSGDQVRITAQLINTRTGTHAWSETYDRHIGDVLKLQDAIAAAIVREMQLTVASTSLTPRSTPKNADAYDLILRGRHALDRTDNEGADEAVTLFQQALDQDPTSADAAAGLANAYSSQVQGGSRAPAIGFEQARRAATNALELDPKNVMARVVLADIHMFYDWDWTASERELKQIATVAPHNVDMLTEEAWLSETLGRWDDALKQIQAALAQDPMNPEAFQNLATIQESRGHLPEAEAAMRRALDIRPTYGYGHYILGLILLARGDRDAALLEMQQETQEDGKRQGLAIVYYALGRKADSDAALAGMLQMDAELNAFGIAEVYGFRGQTDEAMHWLERAYAQKDAYLYTIRRNPLLKNLESDPRYKAFLRKMNLPELPETPASP